MRTFFKITISNPYLLNHFLNLAKMYQTEIISNGSKWGGELPDSIDKLISVLNNEVIEDRFFCKFIERGEAINLKRFVLCPISKKDGFYTFFGNFESVSHVFNIRTNDPDIITPLKEAILNNKGWKMYIQHCKHLS